MQTQCLTWHPLSEVWWAYGWQAEGVVPWASLAHATCHPVLPARHCADQEDAQAEVVSKGSTEYGRCTTC